MHRRHFLAGFVAVLRGAGTARPCVVVLRASDGQALETSGDADSWVAPPGSAVKPFVVDYLLRTGKLNARETYLCRGANRIAGRNFTCSHPTGLPPLNAAHILAYSCNGGVAHFAERLRPDELSSALQEAGFRTGSADVRLQALGEEGVWTTPVDLARAYRKLSLRADPAVLDGLEGAVQYGTAQAAALHGVQVAGKTGSVMAASGAHVAWFAGFAPSRHPEIVVVVGTQGHSGGSDAAPLAAQALRQYLVASGNRYRVRTARGIVSVGSEDYVAGVLVGESSVFAEPEALKAMAIVARTFGAHERGRHRTEGFDFCDTTHCQRFENGIPQPHLSAAVRATAGTSIRFDGRLAFTPYTMSCGGTSEAANAVWQTTDAPYLGIRHDPFCPVKTWGCHLSAPDIGRALGSAQLECPANLHSIAVKRRTASGRAAELSLIGDNRVDVDAGAFRFAVGRTLGWNLIRSNWFDLSSGLDCQGRGEGHGVGLCQRGAEAMAASGHGYRAILSFYFPGTTSLNWLRLGGERVTVYGTDANRDAAVLPEAELLAKDLPWALRGTPAIYVYPDLDAFRSETGEPGWVAAHTAGTTIHLQPVSELRERGILSRTIHHELLHLAMEEHAATGLPLWFREGLVQYLSGTSGGRGGRATDGDIRQRNDRLAAAAAYDESAADVRNLVARYGRETVLGWVSTGLPLAVTKSRNNVQNTNNR